MAYEWEKNILGFLREPDRLGVPFNPVRPNDPIDGLFGDVKTDNIVAQWQSLAAMYQIPAMANFHAFDVEANTAVRVPVDTHNIEKGLIKVKINQSERLRALTRAGVRDDAMYDYVLKDVFNLGEQVITRTKVAKNELLATGKVTIKENNLDLTVDYGVPPSQTSYTLDLSKIADISGQIQAIIDAATALGVTITGMVTSRKNLTKIRNNTGLQTAINGNVGAGTLLRQTQLEAFFSEEFGINTVITNDMTYAAERKLNAAGGVVQTTKRYYPEDRVTFYGTVNNIPLGVGLWGDAPEVDVARFMQVTGSAAGPYIAISQWTEHDPAVLWTKASALFMPVLYNPNSLFIAYADKEFVAVTSPASGANPAALGYYEAATGGGYVLTTDTTVTSGKTYYELKDISA